MIGCDECNLWFHGHCVGLTAEYVEEHYGESEWFCSKCVWLRKERELENLLQHKSNEILHITKLNDKLSEALVAAYQSQQKLLLSMFNKFNNVFEGVDLLAKECESTYSKMEDALQKNMYLSRKQAVSDSSKLLIANRENKSCNCHKMKSTSTESDMMKPNGLKNTKRKSLSLSLSQKDKKVSQGRLLWMAAKQQNLIMQQMVILVMTIFSQEGNSVKTRYVVFINLCLVKV
ncbi:Transcription initiation factor TFIID subunit 3 [Frankliniella fusca]|uniref:Transcription initiation factor TFIID subunit 3 n=1 Tax=Frankliniella fusca TaxID=407009 RepID=A0AAE1GSE0_9NEOP|nr:Transcription initiation factor TFIID subunit 3 [Frankliniella fusca]